MKMARSFKLNKKSGNSENLADNGQFNYKIRRNYMSNKTEQDQKSDSSQTNESINIYLSTQTVEMIEDALFHFRKMLPRENRKKLNRSKLYRLILEDVLTEFNQTGEESRLNKTVSNWNQILTT
jgi:hypothetical protein